MRALVSRAKLIDYIDAFCEKIDLEARNCNKFACAIKRKCKAQSTSGGKVEKGTTYLYTVRCSIAHAGLGDLFIEQFEDATPLIIELLPILEEAVLKLVGIEAS